MECTSLSALRGSEAGVTLGIIGTSCILTCLTRPKLITFKYEREWDIRLQILLFVTRDRVYIHQHVNTE